MNFFLSNKIHIRRQPQYPNQETLVLKEKWTLYLSWYLAIELSAESLKERLKEFGASWKDIAIKSPLKCVVSGPNFETWVTLLGRPHSTPKNKLRTLR